VTQWVCKIRESASPYNVWAYDDNMYWNKTKITYKIWIESNKVNQYRISCPIRCQVSVTVYIYQVGRMSYARVQCAIRSPTRYTRLRWTQSVTVHYGQFIINYYVSEHQLSHVIDASHTTPTIHVNQNPKLMNLIDWRHCPCFS